MRSCVSENIFIFLSHLVDFSVECRILVTVLQKCESVVLLSLSFSVVLQKSHAIMNSNPYICKSCLPLRGFAYALWSFTMKYLGMDLFLFTVLGTQWTLNQESSLELFLWWFLPILFSVPSFWELYFFRYWTSWTVSFLLDVSSLSFCSRFGKNCSTLFSSPFIMFFITTLNFQKPLSYGCSFFLKNSTLFLFNEYTTFIFMEKSILIYLSFFSLNNLFLYFYWFLLFFILH